MNLLFADLAQPSLPQQFQNPPTPIQFSQPQQLGPVLPQGSFIPPPQQQQLTKFAQPVQQFVPQQQQFIPQQQQFVPQQQQFVPQQQNFQIQPPPQGIPPSGFVPPQTPVAPQIQLPEQHNEPKDGVRTDANVTQPILNANLTTPSGKIAFDKTLI